MASLKYALAPTWLTDFHGNQYRAWEIRVPGMLLIFTTAELDRAQKRGRDAKRDVLGRVRTQSVAREVDAFNKAYPQDN